ASAPESAVLIYSSTFMKARFSVWILLTALPALAQSDGWDFLSDASIFPDVHSTLPSYLKKCLGRAERARSACGPSWRNKAAALLDDRQLLRKEINCRR